MDGKTRIRWRASLVAERYLGDSKDWPTERLVDALEEAAYELAREGKTRDAQSLFITVAELSKA